MILGATSTTDDVLHGIDLTGKQYLVTGASAGLGEEATRALAVHGASVTMALAQLGRVRRDRSGTRCARWCVSGGCAVAQRNDAPESRGGIRSYAIDPERALAWWECSETWVQR